MEDKTERPAHTPGPWEIEKELTGYKYFSGRHGILGYTQAHTSPGRILPDAEHAANARLIAAAPDLLAALEKARWTIDHVLGPMELEKNPLCWVDNDPGLTSQKRARFDAMLSGARREFAWVLENIDSAIAKARGEVGA